MKSILPLSLAVALLIKPSQQAAKASPLNLGSGFADCVKYQQQTSCTHCGPTTAGGTTYTYPYNKAASTPYDGYETVTCNFPGQCIDNVQRNNCSWKRYQFNKCTSVSSTVVTIQTATNSLPNHCYYAESNPPSGSATGLNGYVFHSQWNLPVTSTTNFMVDVVYGNLRSNEFVQTSLDSQESVNSKLCDYQWAKHTDIDSYIFYSEGVVPAQIEEIIPTYQAWDITATSHELVAHLTLPNSDQIVGTAINGVLLFAGTSQLGYDAFYPQAYGNKKKPLPLEFDICLGTSQTYNTYRYHMFSPCIYASSLKQVAAPCSSSSYPLCSKDPRQHAIAYIPEQLQTKLPIGLAKDGRVIYGPYKSDGTLWQPCDVDICNGKRDGKIYYYVSSMFHPYFVGCWGPGSAATYRPQCSANTRVCGSNAMGMLNSIAFAALAVLSIFFAL